MTLPTRAAPRSTTSPSPRRRLLALVCAAGAAGMTVLWTVVVPDKAESTTGLQSMLIRFGHPASWALLTGYALSLAVGAPRPVRDTLAWAALASYGAFVAALSL